MKNRQRLRLRRKFITNATTITLRGKVMGRTKYSHSIPLVAFLMALALIGWSVIEFIFMFIVCIVIAATGFYCFLFFAHTVDRIIDYFYKIR